MKKNLPETKSYIDISLPFVYTDKACSWERRVCSCEDTIIYRK